MGKHVSVDVFHEQNNPFDSRAIAFKALIISGVQLGM